MIKIHCNRCNAVPTSNRNLFPSILFFSSKWLYLDPLSFSSLFKIFSSCVKPVYFASTTRPTLFLFSVTVAVRRLSALACEYEVIKRDSSISTWPARVFLASCRSSDKYTLIALVSYSLASALFFFAGNTRITVSRDTLKRNLLLLLKAYSVQSRG